MIASSRIEPLDENLLRGRDILCFSHDWNGDPLSKTHLMRLLAKDNRILWVNSIGYRAPRATRSDFSRALAKLKAAAAPVREVELNLFVLNPLALPFHGRPGVGAINRIWLGRQVRRAMRKLNFQRPINWVFNPAAGVIAGSLGEEMLIYQCVDEYPALDGVHAEGLRKSEEQLLRKADAVIVSAERLLQRKAVVHPRTVLVRHGVDYDHFRRALDPDTAIPADIADIPRPILGFFGLLSYDWIDASLLETLAKRFPQASLVLIGKQTMDLSRIAALPNVHLLGRRPYADLPGYCRAFDVALIPFRISEATLHSNPLKAREYLAAGLPVVSTRIPEVEATGGCRLAGDAEDFVAEVRAALLDPGPNEERSLTVQHETWAARLEEIRGHLQQVVSEREQSRPQKPTLRELGRLIAGDLKRKALCCYESTERSALVRTALTDGTAAMVLYRLMQWAGKRRLSLLEMIFNKLNAACCHCVIGRGADFGPGLVLLHSNGLVINGQVRGGANITLEHQATIGAERRQNPTLGDDVFVGAGAKIIGSVRVGNGARIGANAVVVHDVPAHSTAVGVPARIVRQRDPKEVASEAKELTAVG